MILFDFKVFHMDEYEFIHEIFIRLSQEKVGSEITKKKKKRNFYLFRIFSNVD